MQATQPVPYTNAVALKRTLRRLVKTLIDTSPPPPSGTMKALARNWLDASGGSMPPAVNTWMRRAFTDDSLSTQEVVLTPANAASYGTAMDVMVDNFVAGGLPADPVMAEAWEWMTSSVVNPTEPVPPPVLEFVDASLPTV